MKIKNYIKKTIGQLEKDYPQKVFNQLLEIPKKYFEQCLICHVNMKDIRFQKGCYNSKKFILHLKQHNLTCNQYFKKYYGIQVGNCCCGCGKERSFSYRGSKIIINKFLNGHFFKSKEFIEQNSKRMSVLRTGDKNPMYGMTPWNKGLTKNDDKRVMNISNSLKNKSVSEQTKYKQSVVRKRIWKQNPKTGNSGHKHSESTKKILSINALRMIKEGKLKQTLTYPHVLINQFLKSLNVVFENEKKIDCYSFDIFLKDLNVFIEIDGDYWHTNPKFYKNGPETKSQKINFYRDNKKNQFVKKNNLQVLHFWQDDILNNQECVFEIIKEITERRK